MRMYYKGIRVIVWDWLYTKCPLMKRYCATAFFFVIFIQNKFKKDKKTLEHEYTHIKQQKKYWYIGFILIYGIEYIVNLIISLAKLLKVLIKMIRNCFYFAYYDIHFEKEARESEDKV